LQLHLGLVGGFRLIAHLRLLKLLVAAVVVVVRIQKPIQLR
jgi:hypothetical protein